MFYALVQWGALVLVIGYSGGLVSKLAMTLYPPSPEGMIYLKRYDVKFKICDKIVLDSLN